MNMKQFYQRFDTNQTAPSQFLKELKRIDSGLDCLFNHLEKKWMIIKWKASRLMSEWDWVMTIQDPVTKDYMAPSSYTIDRLKYLKQLFETDELLKMIEREEAIEEGRQDSDLEAMAHELSKDIRKIVINDFDGLVSTWNNFI